MKQTKKVLWFVFLLFVAAVLACVVYLSVMRLFFPSRLPSFFGNSYSLVVSGSMEPTLSAGDMVVCRAQEHYETNDIVVYFDSYDNAFVMHRIVGVSEDGFITKGDFNPICDPFPVLEKDICGKVTDSVPNVKTYRDMLLGALLIILAELMIKMAVDAHRAKKKEGSEGDYENKA